jgi:hypothetical protein
LFGLLKPGGRPGRFLRCARLPLPRTSISRLERSSPEVTKYVPCFTTTALAVGTPGINTAAANKKADTKNL